ncbi:vancomycin permeability regulator SanA [Pseudonocardia hierapolitana]|uniref:Vancomycin permeability regulator SanA n=1 Tax=Pseudonocardia hierapolitana TaxID=1128676 RepID=A0A561SM52_9PSEU|nr:ElyC/SanA/YdcF family protein [Pseudonocardia hierapolitana]TWF75948.1 vancomycin permeability regulator SanA [Pseudonocardia hierapolitana]
MSRKLWVLLALLAPMLVATPLAWFAASTDGRRTTVDRADARPVAIVLGAGLRRDGRPSLLLARRLDIAADLYHRGTVDAVLVTGADDEPAAMQRYLLAAGVPDAKIVGDAAGFRTWDSCVRAREVFGVRSAIVVTQRFHLPRAVVLCGAAGIDATGVGDASLEARGLATVYGWLREVPAAVKALGDTLLRPEPQRMGPPTSTLADALRAPRSSSES